jgi:hypothetical protein
MGATRRNLKAQPKILKKITGTPNIPNENVPKKNYVSYHKSVKETKICMGATRRNLQAPSKSSKSHRNTKSTNQNENFPKKKYVSYLKSEKEQKIRMGLPDGICSGSLKNNRIQVKFRKPQPEKEKCLV